MAHKNKNPIQCKTSHIGWDYIIKKVIDRELLQYRDFIPFCLFYAICLHQSALFFFRRLLLFALRQMLKEF